MELKKSLILKTKHLKLNLTLVINSLQCKFKKSQGIAALKAHVVWPFGYLYIILIISMM